MKTVCYFLLSTDCFSYKFSRLLKLKVVFKSMEVKQLLSEMFRPVRINFPRRRNEYRCINDNLQLNIADLSKLAKQNSNYKYFLIGFNPFTKMLYAEKLKTKSEGEVCKATKKITATLGLQF